MFHAACEVGPAWERSGTPLARTRYTGLFSALASHVLRSTFGNSKLQPGREYKELGRNQLESFRSSLVFEGKRVYVRTEKQLYCIGE